MLITYVCVYTSGGNEEMCSIAGILSKRGIDVADSITDMLTCMPNRGPDGSGILLGDDILFFKAYVTFLKTIFQVNLHWAIVDWR